MCFEVDSVGAIWTSKANIPKMIAQEAYKEYVDQGHGGQSFDRLHERGGFSAEEIAMLLFDRIKRLEDGKP